MSKNNEKVAFLGDSITEFFNYQFKVQKLMDLPVIYTCARTGTRISGDGPESFIARVDTIPLDSTKIFILGGTNDFHLDAPIGKHGDAPSKNTFYGSVLMLIKLIKERCPDAEIVFSTPTRRVMDAEEGINGLNRSGHALSEYAQCIREVCADENVRVMDLYDLSRINEETSKDYLYDGLHPNETGFVVLAEDIAKYL